MVLGFLSRGYRPIHHMYVHFCSFIIDWLVLHISYLYWGGFYICVGERRPVRYAWLAVNFRFSVVSYWWYFISGGLD